MKYIFIDCHFPVELLTGYLSSAAKWTVEIGFLIFSRQRMI